MNKFNFISYLKNENTYFILYICKLAIKNLKYIILKSF